jgi:transcriptional regulator with XRE-family HTH domain
MLRMQQTPDVGALLRAYRVAHGLTQADVSSITRMSIGDISRIECGRLLPSESQVQRLRRVLEQERASR